MPDELKDLSESLLEEAATEGVQTYTSDGETTSAYPLKDQIELDKYANAKAATANGASGWGKLRTARAIPPGGGPD